MAIPPTAIVWPESLDPSDILDFSINCAALLESDETVDTFTAIAGPEAALFGLTITNTALDSNIISMWLAIAPEKISDTAFLNAGTLLPVEITINTDSGRRWQRTAVIRVAQK
jgi:hypothetical protein